jgi:hypothetical protein
MRLFFGSIASLLLGMLVIGCSWVDPSECWVNTSGGFGGGGMIPIGAGVGATSGDHLSSPPRGPLDSDEPPNPCVASDNSSRGSGGKEGGSLTPDEQAAINAIKKADPIEIAKRTDTSAFGAVTASNLVAAQMVDPSTLNATTASQLIDGVAPDAVNAALAWAQSVDPSVFMAGIVPKYECIDPPHNCPPFTKCPEYPGWVCTVTGCGKGSCPTCPEFFENLVVKGWCAYGCMKGTEVVGGAFILQTVYWGLGETHCFPK